MGSIYTVEKREEATNKREKKVAFIVWVSKLVDVKHYYGNCHRLKNAGRLSINQGTTALYPDSEKRIFQTRRSN